MDPLSAPNQPPTAFTHQALFYRDTEEYLAGTVPFIRYGLDRGEPVAVAVPQGNLALLRDALGESAGRVTLIDMGRAGRNPGRIIPAVLRAFADAHVPGNPVGSRTSTGTRTSSGTGTSTGIGTGTSNSTPNGAGTGSTDGPGGTDPTGRTRTGDGGAGRRAAPRVRIIGEPVWPGRSATEYPACAHHEALINLAFAGRPVTILCPYDTVGLSPAVLSDAEVTHPVLVDSGGERRSDAYAPERLIGACTGPLPEPRDADVIAFSGESLSEPRHAAAGYGSRLGLVARRVADVELAVNELATNTVLHGGGTGELLMWADNGHLVCEVRDRGRLTDPLAGRRTPPPTSPGGRGLLMVNLLADLVRTHTGEGGTAVRAYFALDD